MVLDTPGLNAIGAEPELTVNLIPQAQAVVFILAADTGVTKSDLGIWREHVATMQDSSSSRFVVLNKIDALWDELSTPAQIEAQIARQCADTARTLALHDDQVLALSAQKGLLARVRGVRPLTDNRLPHFEDLLGQRVLGGATPCCTTPSNRRGPCQAGRNTWPCAGASADQTIELNGLRGRYQVIHQMRLRIEQKADFDRSAAACWQCVRCT